MGDSPPSYTRFSMPSNQSVPAYTECALRQERVLNSAPVSPVPSNEPSCRECAYRTDHVEVILRHVPWGLQFAGYGKGAFVDGTVRFIKNCSHVLKVSVQLEGQVTNTTSENATVALPGITKKLLFSKEVVLFESAAPSQLPLDRQFQFSIPFPATVEGETDPLPPSYTGFHPGATCEVGYALQVDITRKGLRRHEMRSIPVLYLPKTTPLIPPMLELPVPLPGPRVQDGVKLVVVPPVWANGQQQAACPSTDLPDIYMMLPAHGTFASGDVIPIGLILSCPTAPAIPKLLTPNIGVFLIKRKKMWTSGGRQISIREQLVSKVEDFHLSDLQEGSRYLTIALQGGQPGCECSWSVNRAVAIEYFIRVIIRPPPYAKHLPVFRHDEPVYMSTDQYGTLERELLTMNGIPTPAIGLTTAHAPSRR